MRNLGLLFIAMPIWIVGGFQTSCFAQTVIKGNDCVINGESFFAASNIASEMTRLAKADGILASNDAIKQIAVSGATISSILGFYRNCNPKPTYLFSDGAGIDLFANGNCSDENCALIRNCKNTLLQYLEAMKTSGTKKLLWMIYADPQGSNWAVLKKNQDIWAKVVTEVMASVTTPKVTLVDLRPVWAGRYSQYTSDGIHCTSAGGIATAAAFWKAMKDDNFFELTPTTTIAKPAASTPFRGQILTGNDLFLSLSLAQPATDVTMRILTVSGRQVLTASSRESAGLKTLRFPLGSMAPGMYSLSVQAGEASRQSSLRLP
jgi:hypothetical protein